MNSRHFIEVLIESYERAYSALKGGGLADATEASVIEVAIWAADQVALNSWHGATDRAAQIAAALLRSRYPSTYAAESEGLCPAVRLAVLAGGGDPPTREAMQAQT